VATQKQDESLLEDIWTLLRAGRLENALDLCRSAGQVIKVLEVWVNINFKLWFPIPVLDTCFNFGQPWRAATLCPFGGLDLVPSVEALVKNGKNRMLQAIELESGIGHQWHLWKWASYCASEVRLTKVDQLAFCPCIQFLVCFIPLFQLPFLLFIL
jgi:nuclear pore complex protein Nup107